MNNKIVNFFLSCITTFSAFGAFADGHQTSGIEALEIYMCEYAKGKDIDDLLKVAGEWDDWANTNFSQDYTGFVLTPIAVNPADFSADALWLGATKTQESMRITNTEWYSKGSKLIKKFDAAAPCKTHMYATAMPVRPFKDGKPGTLTAWSCQLKEGKAMADMVMADKIWNDHLDTIGMPGGIYRWFPNEGWPRADKTDFMQVFVTDTLANQGKASDMMIAGSGEVLDNTYGEIFHCDNPRLWQFQFSGSSKN